MVGASPRRLDHGIRQGVEDIDVVAKSARQSVGASTAGQGVGPAIAGQDIGEGIAVQGEGQGTQKLGVLHLVLEGPASAGGIDTHEGQVHAAASQLHQGVADGVDHIGVVARTPGQGIGPGTAIEAVGGGIARQGVGQVIAGQVEGDRAGQRGALNVARQAIGSARRGDGDLDPVPAPARRLNHPVRGGVDDVDVVACAPGQGVCPDAAVQPVGGGVAGQAVGEPVSGQVEGHSAHEEDALDLGGQGVASPDSGDGELDRIGPAPRRLRHLVGEGIDQVEIIARAAGQGVGAAAAKQGVGTGIPRQGIGRVGPRETVGKRITTEIHGPSAHRIGMVDIGRQGVAATGGAEVDPDLVYTHAIRLDHQVRGGVHQVEVVASAAHQGVLAASPRQGIGGGVSGQHIVQAVARETEGQGRGDLRVLEEGREGPSGARGGDGDIGHVGAFARGLQNDIGRAIDDVEVISGPAGQGVGTAGTGQGVGARPALEAVGGFISGQPVGEGIPRQVVGHRAGDPRLLDLGREGVGAAHGGDGHLDEVGPAPRRLDHQVGEAVEGVDVVAAAAHQGVRTRAAVQPVDGRIAGEPVVQGVAREVVGQVREDLGVLEVVAQGPGPTGQVHRHLHQVGPATGEFNDPVRACVDDIDVVASASSQGIEPTGADQGVVSVAAVQHIVCRIPRQEVGETVAVEGEGQGVDEDAVLDLRAEGIGPRSDPDIHIGGIRPAAGSLDQQVIGAVDDIEVVTGPAGQGIDACAPGEGVGAGPPLEQVGGGVPEQGVSARAADGVLDQRARVIGVLVGVVDIALGEAAIAEACGLGRGQKGAGARIEVHLQGGGIGREVVGVLAAAVPDGHEDPVAGRCSLEHPVEGQPPRGRRPGVDGVSRLGAEVGTVHRLEGGDVVHHVGGGEVDRAVGVARERPTRETPVAHDREFQGVAVRRHCNPGRPAHLLGVLEAKTMPDLVQHGEVGVIAWQGGPVVVPHAEPDIAADTANTGDWIVGVGRPHRGVGGLADPHVGDVGPVVHELGVRVAADLVKGVDGGLALQGADGAEVLKRRGVGIGRVVRGGVREAVADDPRPLVAREKPVNLGVTGRPLSRFQRHARTPATPTSDSGRRIGQQA